MKLNQHLKDWKEIVSQRFPNLSLPQISGLATWSFGMVMTQSSSLTRVSNLIAKINGEKENTVRQRLKEWDKEGTAKARKGNKRVSLEVTECFASLLKWVLDLLPQDIQELAIALDATSKGQNFTVLSINLLYRGTAIPLAWKIVKGTEKGSWKPYWKELLSSLKGLVPSDWKVIVTADRGLYADWLYQAIVNLGWHPFLRINHQGQYQIPNSSDPNPLATVVPSPGMSWSGQVTCFKTNPIDCTLLARWDEGYADPWLILTDLTSADANVSWYGFRSWIESSYRDVKSDGWQWQRTRLTNPERAERQWLAMAVALLWTITLGGEQEAESERELISNGSESPSIIPLRQISCFLNGLLTILAQLLMGQPISLGRLFPLPFNHPSHSFISDSS